MPSPRLAALLLGIVATIVVPSPIAVGLDARYAEAEAYEQTLIDCTRSGGWVREDGTCDAEDVDGRVPARPPLTVSAKVSDELARPYARLLARAGYLSHYLGGSIDQRFARIGMADGRAGENLGHTGGLTVGVNAAVLHIHLMFQEEWSYGGWHFRNLTDGRFTQVGIGVWVKGNRTYLVLDFHS